MCCRAIELLKRQQVSVSLVRGSDLDMSSAAGRGVAEIMGAFDTMESEIKSERVAAAALQRAEMGKANGHPAYGWRRVRTLNADGDVIDWHDVEDPEQARVVRWIVDQLLRPKSLKWITADLNVRGVPPPRAALRAISGRPVEPARWQPSTVRKIALRPANIGRVVRGGQEIGDARWPAIVDRDKHEQVVALVANPDRYHRRTADGGHRVARPGTRRHLLTYGLVGRCGGCGAELRVITRGGYELYACVANGGCVARRRVWVDALVEAVVVRRLQEPDAVGLLTSNDGAARAARERAAGLRAKLDNAADAFAEGEITRDQLARITAKVRPQLERADREAARAVRGVAPELVAEMAGPLAQERWDALTEVTQRRALLEAMGVRVTLLPGMRGGPGFRPESVVVEFVDLDAEQAGRSRRERGGAQGAAAQPVECDGLHGRVRQPLGKARANSTCRRAAAER